MARNALLALLAALALWTVAVAADSQKGSRFGQDPSDATDYAAPTYRPGDEAAILEQDAACMKRMGATDEQAMRRKMLMGMQVHPADPAAVIALKSELNLTQDQMDRLRKISEDSRKETRDVLNDDQRATLSRLQSTPSSMVAMCSEMQANGMIGPGTTPGSMPMRQGETGAAARAATGTGPGPTAQPDTTAQPGTTAR